MASTFKDYIYNCYNSRYGPWDYFRRVTWEPREMQTSIPFRKYIRIPLLSDTIEIPCLYKYHVMQALKFNIDNPMAPLEYIYIPLMCLQDDGVESKSSNPLVKRFLYETSPEVSLIRKRGSGTEYLGGEGIIMYNDLTPMMMLTLELKKSASGVTYIPVRQLARISPIIYKRDDLLAKYIRTKFLTGLFDVQLAPENMIGNSYSTRRYRLRDPYNILTTKAIPYDFKVIIEDFSEFFFSPKAPDVTYDSEKINELLLEDNNFMNSI